LVSGALRWRRLDGRYVPGAGATPDGYVLSAEGPDSDPTAGNSPLDLDLNGMWEED
jgi:hypothetical protein